MMNGKILSFAVATALLVSCAYAIVYEDVGNANDFIDKAVVQIMKEEEIIREIEPVHIPDVKHGKLETSNGKLWGLSSIGREGDATYSISDQDKSGNKQDTLFVRANIASHNISFSMHYKLKVLFVTVDGELEGKLDDAMASTRFHLNEREVAVLDCLKIDRFDGFALTKVSAFSAQSSWILKTIANTIAKTSKGKIVEALENGVSNYIRTLLREVTIN